MDKNATIARVLDSAIAKAAESEFDQCTDGMSSTEKLRWVSEAAVSLDRLRSLESPDYADEMVTLFYVARYQLSHVNLAYSLIKAMNDQAGVGHSTLTDTGRLHVIDFGCGALAMQFGVALAVADALEQGQVISKVRVDSIDTSKSMLKMGRRVWAEFRGIVNQDAGLQALKTSCNLIENHYEVHTDYHSVQKIPDADSWISAMHVVYESNRKDVRNALSRLQGIIGPDTGFITCYGDAKNPGNIPIVNYVSPFRNKYRLIQLPAPRLTPQFPEVINNSLTAKIAREWGYFAPGWYHTYCDWPDRTTAFIYYGTRQSDAEQSSSVFDFLRKLFRMVATSGDSR